MKVLYSRKGKLSNCPTNFYFSISTTLLLDFDAAEDVALTQLLKEEGVADIQAYKDYYVPMNKGSLEGLGAKENQ